jgi:hypothetical protein
MNNNIKCKVDSEIRNRSEYLAKFNQLSDRLIKQYNKLKEEEENNDYFQKDNHYIDFDKVTEKMGCGFRHEEFPEIKIDGGDRQAYINIINDLRIIDELIGDAYDDIPERLISCYIGSLVHEKIQITRRKNEWWEMVNEKYNLPVFAKYNPKFNIIYRHITDDNRITSADRTGNN